MGTNTWGIAKAKRFDAVKVLVMSCCVYCATRTPRAMAWLIAPRGRGPETYRICTGLRYEIWVDGNEGQGVRKSRPEMAPSS